MNQFLKRYSEILGSVSGLKEITLPETIRVNTLRISEKDFVERFGKKAKLEKLGFADFGYKVKSNFSIGSTPEYLQGFYYIQEAAAQLPVQVLAPGNELVLEIGSAPGGKTTQLAQLIGNKGKIVAIDVDNKRLNALKNNLERCGAGNCLIYNKDGRYISDFGLKFDKILLDAPCSGNFITDKKWFDKRTLKGIGERSVMQKALLASALSVLRKDGVLVYSTCSLEPEENELVIDWALKSFKIKLEDVNTIGDPGITFFKIKLDDQIKKCRRLWPHKTGTQGFFIAKIRKIY
jgi:NOL1/NOP2/sun family putative RNA methylase